jgi:hypothetical protein
MENNLNEFVLCECSSPEHQLIFRAFEDEDEVYVNVHLCTYDGFFKRLWTGLKYAFGHRSRFGEWDEVVLSKQHLPQLKNVVKHLEK